MAETVEHGYSLKCSQWELSNEYQIFVFVLWMKVALAVEELKQLLN